MNATLKTHCRLPTCLCLLVMVAGCTEPVAPQQLVGTWTLVASGFEAMDPVTPNDLFSGHVTFYPDKTYDMSMQEKDRQFSTHRSGKYSVTGNKLRTVSGAKVTTSSVLFQGTHLVTITRQKNQRDFYMYYLPAPTETPAEPKEIPEGQ